MPVTDKELLAAVSEYKQALARYEAVSMLSKESPQLYAAASKAHANMIRAIRNWQPPTSPTQAQPSGISH